MEIGFDVINDLCLGPEDTFKWINKATSLYCIVAGNISSDTRTIIHTLSHISKQYINVFYVPGTLEYEGIEDIDYRTEELIAICEHIGNVTMLYHNLAIIDGVAIIGANGWGPLPEDYTITNIQKLHEREDDFLYLLSAIEKLQYHLDVKKIIVVTSTVPKKDLYFKQEPDNLELSTKLVTCLQKDTENKTSHWIFGTYKNVVDTTINGVNYINNPYTKSKHYWPKRININL
jgi:hypothetical protein